MMQDHVDTAAALAAPDTEPDSFWRGVRDCIPTLPGYFSIGMAAGVVQATAGLSYLEISLFCLLLYAGSVQFTAVGMIAASSPVTAIITTAFFVNLRYLLLSAALSPYFRHLTPLRNLFIGLLITDETFGVAINKGAKQKQLGEKWTHGLNVTAYLCWWGVNLAGAFVGNWIANPERFGMDYALAGMFIVLLVLSIVSRKRYKSDIAIALLAVTVTVISSPFVSSGISIIIATVVASTVGMVVSKRWT